MLKITNCQEAEVASFDNLLQLYDKSSHFKVKLVGQNKKLASPHLKRFAFINLQHSLNSDRLYKLN